MSNLEELIERLCPDGVEYKKIGELVDYEQPGNYIVSSTKYSDEYNIPVLTAGQTFILGYINETDGVYKSSKDNPVIIFDDFTAAFKWVDFEFKVKSSAIKILTVNNTLTTIRYIYHVMGFLKISSDEHKRLWIGTYSNIKVPVPPLEVQREIVRILDNFTEIQQKLQEELAARQKQYEYYRDLLLTFKPNESTILNERTNELELSGAIRWMKLGDIADIGTGNGNTNEGLDTGKYPFFVRSQDIKYKNEYDFDETAIITSGDGVGVGKIFHFVSGKYALHQRAYRVHIISDNVLPKYFFYYFKNSFLTYISKASFHSSVTSIRRPMMINFPVPVPPLEVQQRIVGILDRFDVLCNDISSGLPAEIEARQKQYEYYRDKLLTFKELKKEA